MAHIKKLVMQGFKSFAKRTEIPFDSEINTIIGPNGSGKSNVTDALCFVLGRLSIKSIRAAKASNLLFMGSKFVKPAKEASVELIFDNSNKTFAIPGEEMRLKRIVRRNGQSIYKINDETKTRTEIIELLAHAGIDPHGFNLILQGQIQSIVKMHPEERRKIIEEVAGIAIYESRKERSLKELEKTDERLKEISAILRERTSYLNNLDRERKQALRHKELETTIKRAKAGIFTKKKETKEKELNSIHAAIEKNFEQKEKKKEELNSIQKEIDALNERSQSINKHIQQSTGVEQDTLHTEIANLKAELEGKRVRKESQESRGDETSRRIDEMKKSLPLLEEQIKELREKSPMMARKAQELKLKKEELSKVEEERKVLLTHKSELNSLKERLEDKSHQRIKIKTEIDTLVRQLEENYSQLSYDSIEKVASVINSTKEKIEASQKEEESLTNQLMGYEKSISVSDSQIETANETKGNLTELDICPLCQTNITKEHIDHVITHSNEKISKAEKIKKESQENITSLKESKIKLNESLSNLKSNLMKFEREILEIKSLEEKQLRLKSMVEEEKQLTTLVQELAQRRTALENKTFDLSKMEERYNSKLLEIEEISSRTEEDIDTTLLYKEREIENTKNIVKNSSKDLTEIEEHIAELSQEIEERESQLEKLEEKEKELNEKFKKMFKERDEIQNKVQEESISLSEMQNTIRQIEDQVNYLKIGKAKLDAEIESLVIELEDFKGVEVLQGSIENLQERLQKAQVNIGQIGSINMRALEVYDQIKEEYDRVYEKVETLEKEKTQILKIVEEIDKKKKKTFMITFKAINELFTENFRKLSSKGTAYLEIGNKEDIFAGGINIIVKLAKSKFFDVSSLSGGEQTLVALSLLFSIQEHKPYHFYIFDEIDAALDKRNSERLAGLLNQHMKRGQYIVISHNDALIMNSNVLYGVSMHEGVSKVLSIEVKEIDKDKK